MITENRLRPNICDLIMLKCKIFGKTPKQFVINE